jgi:pimeloyl-ACP methyl ester carboxylesterase
MTVLTRTTGSFVNVNGLDMYYEVHGDGEPIVLLHGALSTISVDFARLLPLLAQTRQVIAVEQQAHGHTADVDRPFSFAQMADDTAALLAHIGIGRADVFGYSMGGGVALEMAIRHPHMVRTLMLAATAVTRDGCHPGLLEGVAQIKPEDLFGTPFHDAYLKEAPQPENWAALVRKNAQFDGTFGGWSPDVFASLTAPTLILIGDSDIVRPEHAVELFRLLGGGVAGDIVGLPKSQLAILPGTTHITLVHRAEWLASMISTFMNAAAH